MAKKKKVLTDNDYEEFNKWMTEQESKPTPSLRMFQSWFVVSDLQCCCVGFITSLCRICNLILLNIRIFNLLNTFLQSLK